MTTRLAKFGVSDSSDAYEFVLEDEGVYAATCISGELLRKADPIALLDTVGCELRGLLRGFVARQKRIPELGVRVTAPGVSEPAPITAIDRTYDPPRVRLGDVEVSWADCEYA